MKTSSVKLTALLLIAAMLFALAGCGGGSSLPINELHDQDYKEEPLFAMVSRLFSVSYL